MANEEVKESTSTQVDNTTLTAEAAARAAQDAANRAAEEAKKIVNKANPKNWFK